MGTKRPFTDVDSRNADDKADLPANVKRQRQLRKGKHRAKQGTNEFSKKRARNIQRLLQRRQDLPANVLHDLERELETHKVEVADKAFQRQRSAMISKYHMVRFFERRKASRLVKQLKRQIQEDPESDDTDRLKQDLHIAEVDEAYTLYFPHLIPYVGLYGNTQSAKTEEEGDRAPSAKEALKAGRPPMWSVVEGTLAEGPEALKRLRERRSENGNAADKAAKHKRPKEPAKAPDAGVPRQPQQGQQREHGLTRKDGKAGLPSGKGVAQPQLNRRERRLMHQAKAATDGSDGEEDDGFFEDL